MTTKTYGKEPLQAKDFLGGADSVPNTFGNVTAKETSRNLGRFDPEDYPNLVNPSVYDDPKTLRTMDAQQQGKMEQLGRGLTQLGANFASGFGQGVANMVDVASWGNDNYQSKLFGISTEDMHEWAMGVARNNEIKRVNPGEFEPGSFAWLMEQTASAGTGLGMGAFALLQTAAIEGATMGLGTGAALGKLASLFKRVRDTEGVAAAAKMASRVKDLRSAATTYGVLSRTNESRMEAMMSHKEITDEMTAMKNPDGSAKYTAQEVEEYANAGADRTYMGNMALLPLDILGYRTMVFNPISGSSTGLIERGLAKIGNKYLRGATQFGVTGLTEGTEEGLQYIASSEGKHYARVLGGMDDATTFLGRVGGAVGEDEFWNNFAGGVIGSPIIGGFMKLTNKAIDGGRTRMLNELHNDYVKNVGKMDSAIGMEIMLLQQQGKHKEADIVRRQFRNKKALGGIHYDAMTDKDTAFNAHIAYLQGTLDDVTNGKAEALQDVGFESPTPEQIEYVKKNFQDSIDDAHELKAIYDSVKDKYNKNFVPEVTSDHFQLNKLLQEKSQHDLKLAGAKTKLTQYDLLSSYGREQYEAEYDLLSLHLERARLTEQHRATENQMERDNINALIKSNELKLTKINDRLQEIATDDTYAAEEKEKDSDIIRSALTSPAYQRLNKDNVHLENAIALQRKNIALWNNPKYLDQRNKESINKARTRAQVQNTKDAAANKPGGATAEETEAANKKESEIAAAEAAQAVVAQQNASSVSSNFDMFSADNDYINGMKGKKTTGDPEDTGGTKLDLGSMSPEASTSFAPEPLDIEGSPQETKDKVVTSVAGLIARLGGEPNFEDLIRHIAKVQGIGVADELFNAAVYGWEKNNMPPQDYASIYTKIFGDPMNDFVESGRGMINTNKKLSDATDVTIAPVEAKANGQTQFDPNSQPKYFYKDKVGKRVYVTNESSPKFAFLTKFATVVRTQTDEGIEISFEYTADELNVGEYVDSLQLLDPDRYVAGTAMEIMIPANHLEIKVPMFNPDGTKGTAITFGQYLAQNPHITPDSPEYLDKIPMIIYDKGKSLSGQKGLAFVHDVGWYHPERFDQDSSQAMANAIAHTRQIREAVLADRRAATPIEITEKRQTTFEGLKTNKGTEYNNITLREANPDTELTIAMTATSLNTARGELGVRFPNDTDVLMNIEHFRKGAIIDVRRYGTNSDGKKTYMGFPTFRDKLDKDARASVLRAIYIYAHRSNPKKSDKHQAVVDTIRTEMGIDIYSPAGIEAYLNHFMLIFNSKTKAGVNQTYGEVVEGAARANLAPGTPFVALQGGHIIFGRTGQNSFTNAKGKGVGSQYINPNVTDPKIIDKVVEDFAKSGILDYFEQNVDLPNLNANKPIITIGAEYTTNKTSPSYKDYLLDRIKTNVRSHNIGTAAEPNYVTNIQPVITFDLVSNLDKQRHAPTNDEMAKKMEEEREVETPKKGTVVEEEEEVTPPGEPKLEGPSAEEMAEKAMAEWLARAEKGLGKEFNEGEKLPDLAPQASYAPTPMTEAQIEYVKESLLRIAGLTPDQQFDIVDFIYNQIVAMVDLDSVAVSRTMVDGEVKAAFDKTIAPIETHHKEEVRIAKELIAKFPQFANSKMTSNIATYEKRLAQIEAVRESFDVLQEEAYNRVAKYTGITEDKVTNEKENDQQSSEENPETNSTEEEVLFGGDFSTNVLTESPEQKLTYSMRRFFGQINEYDKDGKIMKGFLGLDTYVGSDEVVRRLMTALADTPADFDTMIAKLKTHVKTVPWMAEVIRRLESTTNQKKSQFVTAMDNSSLRMKFVMITENKMTGTWTTKVYDTNLSGVADAIEKEWRGNLTENGRDIVMVDDVTGHYVFNKERAKYLIKQYESWLGIGLAKIPFDMSGYRPTVDQVKPAIAATDKAAGRPAKTMNIKPIGELLTWLNQNLTGQTTRVQFSLKGQDFQVTRVSDNEFKIASIDKQDIKSNESVDKWLRELGIELHPDTLSEILTSGMYHNYGKRSTADLFTSGNGLFHILHLKLKLLVEKEGVHDFTEEGDNLLDDSVIGSLAVVDAKYNTSISPFAFRDAGKSIFALTARKSITDTVMELKDPDNHALLKNLMSTSYSSPSLWLQCLKSSPKFRTLFKVSHIGLTAFKQQGKKLYKDTGITKLADTDHELDKLGFFWDMTQGEVELQADDSKAVLNKYPGTDIAMRMATMFSPTMSDKEVMTLMTTAVLHFQNADLNNGDGGITDEVVTVIYEQVVKPELKRMIKHAELNHKTNVKSYDAGAKMFLNMPALNDKIRLNGDRLVDLIYNQPADFNLQFLEQNEEVKKGFNNEIRSYVESLVKEKLKVWETDGITKTDADGKVSLQFFDKKYMDKFRGDNRQRATMAAMDYVINSLVANSNSFMAIIGDPAQMYKVDETTTRAKFKTDLEYDVQVAKDVFTNVGKRLANQIAPGTGLANSAKEQYLQLMLADRKGVVAENIEYLEKILGKEGAAAYRDIEAADGQEYTTWKEHLDILSRLGKNGDGLMDITQEQLNEAAEIFEKGEPITPTQQQLITKIMQPMKPVYTGRMHDEKQDMMRVVYIKCSSFPLIPQLTKGMEIDKLRLEMEQIQKDRKMNVRASYQSANKVGGVTNPIKLWNDDGTANEEALKAIHDKDERGEYTGGMLVLDRKNFRIQQDVPFKSGKQGEDTISLGTQLMKLLFGDEIMNFNGFSYNGEPRTGTSLHKEYNDLFLNLVKEKKAQLFDELGLDEFGIPKNANRSMAKLQDLLKNEAIKRGYPLQDIEGLTLIDGEFNLPLWASSNSNRYESMLNAIITNRIIKMKFPGVSSVVGSEEGFIRKKQEIGDGTLSGGSLATALEKIGIRLFDSADEEVGKTFTEEDLTAFIFAHAIVPSGSQHDPVRLAKVKNKMVIRAKEANLFPQKIAGVDESQIIYTSAWNGTHLTSTVDEGGTMKKAQVLMPSKFKGADGNLIDLFKKVDGKYIYIEQKAGGGFTLKQDMFDKELLSMLSFRIPTSGHQSASQIEIAGFLPAQSADLMIVPRNFTKQKGLDFDVDKENSYQFWTHTTKEGKLEMLQEKHRRELLFDADREMKKADLVELRKEYEEAEGPNAKKHVMDKVRTKIRETHLLNTLFEAAAYDEQDFEENKYLRRLNSKINEKLMQNELIKINHSVFNNPDPKLQAKIARVLNTKFAEKQAMKIEELTNLDRDSTYWTPLSDEYQKAKLISGASGKIATGAFSLDVVFHSMAQQARISGKPITLIEVIDDPTSEKEGAKKKIPKTWRFGTVTSDPELGGFATRDKGRDIAEVVTEAQQIAVDNEKLQVMGRVGLNDMTLDVFKMFMLTGIDKGADGDSIPFLFLSQPIIRDFVLEMKNINSIMAEFSEDKEQAVIDKLIAKYDPEKTWENVDPLKYEEVTSDLMNNDNFRTGIRALKPDALIQRAVLNRFLDMRKYGIAVRGIQTSINTDSKGLGKSFFDVIDKREKLNKLGVDTDTIQGASALIGDYIRKAGLPASRLQELQKLGYMDIGQYMVLPETLSGGFSINGVTLAYNLWSRFFPYDTKNMEEVFKEILAVTTTEKGLELSNVEKKQHIFQNVKKFLAAEQGNGLTNDEVNAERARLYIDTDTNRSLATYIKGLKNTIGDKTIDEYIKTNKLLNRFEFDGIQKNGMPSLVKYNNADGEEFDEQYLYDSMSMMLTERNPDGSKIQLPSFNGKEYTLDELAQDMILAAYLGNAVQEAIQYTKYVPVAYLNAMGYSLAMRKNNDRFHYDSTLLGLKMKKDDGTDKHFVSRFTMQYIQHYPERVQAKYDAKKLAAAALMHPDGTFTFIDGRKPTFVSVYDTTVMKGDKKFKLYWLDGTTGRYVRIPILGAFGMDEYQPAVDMGVSSINTRMAFRPKPAPIIEEENPDTVTNNFDIKTGGDVTKMVTNISKSTTPFALLAKELIPFVDGIKVVTMDSIMIGEESHATALGVYEATGNTIYIKESILSNADKLADTFMHEIVHGVTVRQLMPYIDGLDTANPQVKTSDAPAYVSNLIMLYNRVKNSMPKGEVERIAAAMANKQKITQAEIDQFYGMINLKEFITMAMTNKKFQAHLSNIPMGGENQSALSKFKQIINAILTAMGVDIKPGSVAEAAFNNIFELIEAENIRDGFDPHQMQYGDMNDTTEGGYFNENDLWPTGDNLSPSASESVSAYIASLSNQEKIC